MRKIIALSENPNDGTMLGIVLKGSLCDVANSIFYELGFKPKKQMGNLSIMKSDLFLPNALDDFVSLSGFDSDLFNYFICRREDLDDMIKVIEQDD